MCIAVYLGSHKPLKIPDVFPNGSLGIEPASWTPAPLANYSNIYYIGGKGEKQKLECSCMLVEHIVWYADGVKYENDELYPETGECPFETLRRYVNQVMDPLKPPSLVCDDSGGVFQTSHSDEYEDLFTTPSRITKGSLMFSHPQSIPIRHYYILPESIL
jgi:hypothetical protein